MIYRSMTLKGCTIPNFNLNGMILHVVASYKYLGHYITDDLSDDDDINRQRRTLFVQGNIILRKFNMCSLGVKLTLFRTYCSPMYTAQLWWNYKKSTITKLQIAYHNIFKMFLGMSKYESTSYLCTLFDIQCCQSVIRKLVYGFMCRLDSSVNLFPLIPACTARPGLPLSPPEIAFLESPYYRPQTASTSIADRHHPKTFIQSPTHKAMTLQAGYDNDHK